MEATRCHAARQGWRKLALHMLVRVAALQDAELRDIRAEKRTLRFPDDAREVEALELREVARFQTIHEKVELAFAEATGDPFIVVRNFL